MGIFSTGANLPDLPNIDKWVEQLSTAIDQYKSQGDEAKGRADEQFSELHGLIGQLVGTYAPEIAKSYDFGSELRDLYRTEALPLEQKFLRQADNYDTTERRNRAAAEAGSDVVSASEAARSRAKMDLMRYGIDPTDPRFAMMSTADNPEVAAQAAAASNKARDDVENKGLALRQQAINIGKTWDQQAGQWIDRGGNIGQGLADTQGGAIRLDAAVRGRSQDWYGQQLAALQQMIDTKMQRYEAKVGRAGARSAARGALGAGVGQLVGTLGGAGVGFALGGPWGAAMGANIGNAATGGGGAIPIGQQQ